MRKILLLAVLLGAFAATNAYAIPQPLDCFGGIDINLTPTYWYLQDENGYTLENGDWCYVAWKGPDGIKDPPNKIEPNCGDVTGDDVIIGEGTIYYGSFTITVATYAVEDGQHPAYCEEVYCRIFNEPKYPACETGWYGDSDQHHVENVLGEVFFAKFTGDPFYGYTDIPLPVELMSFDAIGRDSEVLLEWKTATETNLLGFYIERDQERLPDFTESHTQNSAIEQTYTYVDKGLTNGVTYSYNLVTVDLDGVEQVANEEPLLATPTAHVPKVFALHQNYPNPFNPWTDIKYDIPKDARVTLKVYNVLGAEVATLVDEVQKANFYTVRWDAKDLASGVYFCTINAGDFKAVKKMVLLK